MSINMSDVKAITLGGQDVKKIETTQGVVLWEKPTTNPYRELEYIYLDGTDEYVETPSIQTYNRYRALKFYYGGPGGVGGTTGTVFGSYDLTQAAASQKYYLGDIIDGTKIRVVDGGTNSSTVNISFTTIYVLEGRINNTTNKPSGTMVVYNEDKTSQVGNVSVLTNSVAVDGPSPIRKYIGAYHKYESGTNTAENFVRCRIYYYNEYEGITLNSLNILYSMVPVQRKADSKCGLYDCVNNIFYPINGTTTTSGAAGPTVNENFVPTLTKTYNSGDITQIDATSSVPVSITFDSFSNILNTLGIASEDDILSTDITVSFTFKCITGGTPQRSYNQYIRTSQNGLSPSSLPGTSIATGSIQNVLNQSQTVDVIFTLADFKSKIAGKTVYRYYRQGTSGNYNGSNLSFSVSAKIVMDVTYKTN